jgi:UDP-N-acetylglucosamine 2-epimerase
LNAHYFARKSYFDRLADAAFFRSRGIVSGEYYLMTCHRRENVQILSSLQAILELVGATDRTIFFPASYRTQKLIQLHQLRMPVNVIVVDPVGYEEMLSLTVNSRGVISDSGTLIEEACVLQIPSLQIRKSTERPQVYDVGASVKFDPAEPQRYPPKIVHAKFEALHGKTWLNPFGDGHASERIVADLIARLREGRFRMHQPSDYHLDVERSYRGDGF